jgi:HK97 family phage major capsid protein/HK97 family phage prohead protease
MTLMNRAYAMIDIKSIKEDERLIEGIATTPSTDRVGDIVMPEGAKFSVPMPLLWQHKSDQPVGHVEYAKPSKAGIPFKARIAKSDEPGTLKDRLDEAWQSVKLKLVPAVSIGFSIKNYEVMKEGGWRIKEWDWMELSLVTIPANADCTIDRIKSLDAAMLAATGHKQNGVRTLSAGVTASRKPVMIEEINVSRTKTYAEQITALEASRQAKSARREEIQNTASDENRTKEEAEQVEFDDLGNSIKTIDRELVDLRDLEKNNKAAAVAVNGATPAAAAAARSGVRVENVKRNLPPGIAFARMTMARARSFKEMMPAHEIAKAMWPDHTELHEELKAAVAVGSSTTLATLVQPTVMASELIEYLWHRTIIGRIQGLRRVPFNIKVPRQTSVASVSWVGEAAPKPLSAFALDTVSLGYYKIAGIVALTDEIVKFSSPAAEAMVRDELANAIVTLMDHDFIDPEKAAVAGVSPASLTNGVTPITATGTAYSNFAADLGAALANFDAAKIDTSSLAIVMSTRIARSLGMMLNSLGQPLFPNVSSTGGTVQGYQVIVSGNVDPTGDVAANGDNIILIKPDEIFVADDGSVSIDISREASVQMDGAPDNPALATTITISAFQHNLALIRAERYCNWLKRRAQAVQYISGAKYA